VKLPNLASILKERSVFLERGNKANFFKDWNEQEILDKINTTRAKDNKERLVLSEKLSKSASARLAVIITENDYDGTKTGLTRELAITNAGYDASLIGDLTLVDFFRSNDPISYWNSDEISKGTLFHKDFKEVGIAIRNHDEKVDVYLLFVTPRKKSTKIVKTPTWGGPELWSEINKRRVEMGVNPLIKRDELCTIASIRLNQLLELNKLDGHEGFTPVLQRQDLKWIAEKYDISEYLAQGYNTAADTVKGWESTMGHRTLLAGGEYVWGCVYAQNTFSVAIAAY